MIRRVTPDSGPGGSQGAGRPQRVSITAKQPLPDSMQGYAREKLGRLAKHAHLHDVTMIIDHDIHSHRLSHVEVVAHLHHVRIAARGEGVTLPEAIDQAVERADRQVLQRKDRVTARKGRLGADGVAL